MEEKIRKIIEDTSGIDLKNYPNSFKFMDDLGCDSLDVIDIIMRTEREFNISIPDSDVTKIVTIQDLIDYITKRCK